MESNAGPSTATEKEVPAPLIFPKRELNWPAVLFYIHLNALGLFGIFVLFTNTSFLTMVFTLLLTLFGALGVTAGSHRLWAHNTYTASKGLKIFLMICQTLAGQGSIYNWVRLHRLHHKTFKTPEDPLYSAKDFFAAHVKAQVQTLSQDQKKQLEEIDMSDLEKDTVVMFQKKYYWILFFVFHVLLPINSPLEYWGDSVPAAIYVAFSLRYLIVLNISWFVESAHFVWNLNKDFKPSDSNSVFLITKSYWHQYHYLIPCDYQTGEFGEYGTDCTTVWIRIFAAMGCAFFLQTVSSEAVRKGLTEAVETNGDIVECITAAAKVENSTDTFEQDQYLNTTKYL